MDTRTKDVEGAPSKTRGGPESVGEWTDGGHGPEGTFLLGPFGFGGRGRCHIRGGLRPGRREDTPSATRVDGVDVRLSPRGSGGPRGVTPPAGPCVPSVRDGHPRRDGP